MARRQWSKDEASAARTEKVEAALSVLEGAVSALKSGDDWRGYLEFQSKLHDYSANNVMLIVAQHMSLFEQGKVPAALPSYVASYRKWLELGRQVDKGQTGLAIIAPMCGTRRVATDDDGNVIRALAKDEQPEAGEQEVKTSFMRGSPSRRSSPPSKPPGPRCPCRPGPSCCKAKPPAGLAPR